MRFGMMNIAKESIFNDIHRLFSLFSFYFRIRRPPFQKSMPSSVKTTLTLLLLFCASAFLRAQDSGEPFPAATLTVQVGKVLYKGDSIHHIITPTLYKYPERTFTSEKERRQYNRLVMNVKKVLPLAKKARLTILETYAVLETMPTEAERAAHIRAVEKGLKKQYTPLLKKLTRSQGKLFIKLIDRECNQTGYSIAKAFIGPGKAGFYQALAFCFGQSLTRKYDPEGDDRFTERVVRMVES